MEKKIKILMFANIPIEGERRSLGGATVLTQEILWFLSKNNLLDVKQVQIRKFWKSKYQLIDYLLWIIKFPFAIKGFDVVSIHATKDMHFYFMPLLIVWLRLFRKKYVYHCFAGTFHKEYESKSRFHRQIISKTVLKADYLFFETKEIVSYFTSIVDGTCVWLPNCRRPQKFERKPFTKKFVFISRILPCKGVGEIIEVAKQLPKDYIVDFYGPINNDFYSDTYFADTPINYCGIIPDEVISTIKKYDIMLLPTHCYGEGYPGTIIESLSVGVPVITTLFNAIPEIIEDELNGRLVPIKNSDALLKAMLSFSEDNYPQYVDGAIGSFINFNSDLVFKKFIDCYLDGKKA
jgi:glycosyltransferase involved in cell wall biosynthesis